jgi:hypothetical protein
LSFVGIGAFAIPHPASGWCVTLLPLPIIPQKVSIHYVCHPHSNVADSQALAQRTSSEIVLSIVSIAGGIAMACKMTAELSKKVRVHAPTVFVQSPIFDCATSF